MNGDEIARFIHSIKEAVREPSEGNVVKLLENLLPFSPAGVEWGIEVSYLAGITYMLEDGKVLAVRVSRDEFGPFMQTSIAPMQLSSIPTQALKPIQQDVRSFIKRVSEHLTRWLEKAPQSNPKRERIRALLDKLREEGMLD